MIIIENRDLVHGRERLCRRLALISSAAVAIVASSVLVGWMLGDETLERFALGTVVMLPLTAVSFICAAGALAFRTLDSTRRRWRWCGHLLSALVLAIGLVMLAQRVTGFELGLNLLLFPDSLSRYPYRPLGLMAGNSALGVSLLGAALAFPNVRVREREVANGFALAVVGVASLALVGYVYGARALFSVDRYAAMALSTAVSLLSLAVGVVVSKPQRGLGAALVANDAGAILTRRMLPIALTVPFLLGLGWLVGRRVELFGRETGIAIFVVAVAGIYTLFLFHSGRSVSALDRECRTALEDAKRAQARAEDANQGKVEFLTMMNHELRTPLNAIRGYTQLIELGVRGPVTAEQRRDLERIRRNEEHLLGIIGDILDFAAVERGTVRFEIGPVALQILLNDATSTVAPLAASKGIRIITSGWNAVPEEFQSAKEPLMVLADAQKLLHAFINLLSNAIKFSESGNQVVIEAQSCHDSVRVSIADSGRGISPERLATIFDPFTQSEPALRRTTEGVGLGLAISRQLLRGMDSDIHVESALGVGSRFSIELRRAPSSVPASPLSLTNAAKQVGASV